MKPTPKRLRLTRRSDVFRAYLRRVCERCGIVPRVAVVAVKL